MTLKQTALFLSTLALAGTAMAQQKAPEPDYTLSYNVGVVTDYRYRGISQTARKPALQGGLDFSHKSGFYLGAWGSTIRWIKDSSAPGLSVKGPVEIDLYGGYKGTINDTFSYDVGGLQYWYPGNKLNKVAANANTFELYGALTAGPATLKYSHSLTNLFGTPNSKNSGYLDLSATFDLGNGFSLTPHVGHQSVHNWSAGSYTDYSLTLAKDFGNGFSLSGAAIGTDSKNAYLSPTGKNLGKSTLVVGVKYSF